MHSKLRTASLIPLILACACADGNDGSAGTGSSDVVCRDPERVRALPAALSEASGLAASRRTPGLLWTHNDSDSIPRLFALRDDGTIAGEMTLAVRRQRQWEDIASGPCPAGDCLYVGDIGDNSAQRKQRFVIRFPEPDPATTALDTVERFQLMYPDGPVDAEAIFVLPDTSLFIITKGRQGPVTVYRTRLVAGQPRAAVEKVQELTEGLVQLPDMVTGASASSDGRFVAVRTYTRVHIYRVDNGRLERVGTPDGYMLESLAEPQGEGIALLDDGTVFLVSETGPFDREAFLSRLACTLPGGTGRAP